MSLLYHELVHLLLTSLVAIYIRVRFRKGEPGMSKTFKAVANHPGPSVSKRLQITNNKLLITGIFFVGLFLDVDHLFDYFMWSKGTFILSDFLNPSLYVHLSGKVYVPFHGYEIGLILLFVSRWAEKRFKLPGLSLALTLSYFIHLLWDNFSFSHHPLAYSLIYRIINHFNVVSFDGAI